MSLYAIKPSLVAVLDPMIQTAERCGVNPNHVTLLAIPTGALFSGSVIGGAIIPWLWLTTPLFATGVMALNAMDGELARRTRSESHVGRALNELTDRVGDMLLALPAFVLFGGELGWAVVASILVAEIPSLIGWGSIAERILGGPMGKPDRVAIVSTGAVASFFASDVLLWLAYVVVAVGSWCTGFNRVRRLLRKAARSDRATAHAG